ncbi:hypothetical protein AKJ16_DCAP15555 [Drosera capensis]
METYSSLMEWFEELGIDMDTVDTSFSVSLDKGEGCEWGSRNGLTSLFAQKKNALSLHFLKMLQEIHKFKNDVLDYIKVYEDNAAVDTQKSLGDFFKWRGYSELFLNCYVVPICCSIWFCSPEQVLTFSAFRALKFLNNHHLLQLFGGSQWHTMKGGSFLFVNKMKEKLEARDCLIQTNCIVNSISTCDGGKFFCCKIFFNDGSYDIYDGCIMAIQAPDAMKVLGEEATYEEARILGAFQYRNWSVITLFASCYAARPRTTMVISASDVFLHQDKSLMPQSPAAWSARNFLQNAKNIGSLTYWLNGLQNINASSLPFFVTINPSHGPDTNFLNWSIGNPIPTCAAAKASSELDCIQGRRRIWFCGKYQEDVMFSIHPFVLFQDTGFLTFQIHIILWIENNARFDVTTITFSALSARPCSSTISPSSSSELIAVVSRTCNDLRKIDVDWLADLRKVDVDWLASPVVGGE